MTNKARKCPALDSEQLWELRRRCCSGRHDNPLRLNYPADIPNEEGYELVVVLQDGSEVPERVVAESSPAGRVHSLSRTHIGDVVGWKKKR
jgi:hypothetical protein